MSDTLKNKLDTIRDLVDECLAELGSGKTAKAKPAKSAPANSADTNPDKVLQIVNKVGDCDEATAIEKHVLSTRGSEGRVLLAFYIVHKYFKNAWLTSGDVEKITADLGIKIDKKNVSNYLVTYRKYLESGAVRRKGQSTPYRMKRAGAKRFEEIIHEKE